MKWCIIQLSWIWVEFDEKWFRSFKSSDFYLFDFKCKMILKFLDVFMCISYHKNCFWVGFLQNSKIFTDSINWNRLLTNWKCLVFKPKLYAWFDRLKIPSLPIRSMPNSSRPIEIWIFRILKAFDRSVFVLSHHLSFTPLDPS